MIGTVTVNPSLDEWVQLPRLRLGALNRAVGFQRYPGGKGINVSRVVRELGGATCAHLIAGGADGAVLLAMLEHLGIPHDAVRVQDCTRNNYKLQTGSPRALTEINTAGPPVSRAVLLRLQGRLLRAARATPVWALSGSLPPGAPSTLYARWIRLLQRRGACVLLDASGSALRAGVRARPWAIKPNRQEAEELLGRRLSSSRGMVAGVRDLLALGSSVAILSLGKEGALLASRQPAGVWWARSPRVRVRSAVGAGDSLVGGFLTGWAATRNLLGAFQLGVACGTAGVLTPGTTLCRRQDVRRMLPRVRLQRIA